MIIGLAGPKQSGKDTLAAYLIKEHDFERRAFADPLKKSVAALLNIPYHKIDEWKNDPDMTISVERMPLEDAATTRGTIYSELTFREFLQRYGTEAHRDVFGEHFWLDFTLPADGSIYYGSKKIVLTDCRFTSEAARVNHVGGFIVGIDRPGLELQDQHSSEAGLPRGMIDYTVMNSDTIEVFYENIEVMLTHLGEKKWAVA